MKFYRGERTIDGIVVTVDNHILDQQLTRQNYSENGFEWSYEGPEPQQLAFAILVDHLDNDHRRAQELCKLFMCEVITKLDNMWEMTTEDINNFLKIIKATGK